jgi:colicin import membrane protein
MTTPTTTLALVQQGDESLQQLPPSKADQIRAVFIPMAELAESFDDAYNEVMAEAAAEVTPGVSKKARRLRLDIAKVRIQAEHARKETKAQYLLASQAIDGTARILKWAISEKEEALEKIEKHAERMEAERIQRLQEERAELLAAYVEDAHERDLGTMETDVWDAYLATKKQAHEDRLEAERLAEEARKEQERIQRLTAKRQKVLAPLYNFVDAPAYQSAGELSEDDFGKVLEMAKAAKLKHEKEQERIRAENERLAKEKAAAEAKARKEREAAEKKRKAELAKIEAERKAEREKLEAEAKARAEKARKEREAELARIEAERRKEREAAEAERARLEALAEAAPLLLAALKAILKEAPAHAWSRHESMRPLLDQAREAVEAAEPQPAEAA